MLRQAEEQLLGEGLSGRHASLAELAVLRTLWGWPWALGVQETPQHGAEKPEGFGKQWFFRSSFVHVVLINVCKTVLVFASVHKSKD